MSDVSKANELIAELRKAQDAAGFIPHGTMDHETQWLPFANLYNAAEALLEDLEAATRVPVQGEPNDDREALKRIAEVASEQRLKDSIAEYKDATSDEMEPTDWELEFWHAGYKSGALSIIEHNLSRATVPDAATEAVSPEWIEDQRAQGWPDMHPEDYCHKCGAPNQTWCAASREDWLSATSAWASETGREGICCVSCFAEMYREQTGSDPIWMLSRHMPNDPRRARERENEHAD